MKAWASAAWFASIVRHPATAQRLDRREHVRCSGHGIETSDLKERQTTILNSGVIVQGGDVNAESLAVGSGSQAVKTVKKVLGGKAKGASE